MRKSDVQAGPWPQPMELRIPDRDGVVHVFPNGVRGQESVWLDLQFPGVECTAEEDKCRQEHALSTDIGYQISRFGVGHPVEYGEQNFDLMDRTLALEVVEAANQAWLTLPRVVRDRYQSWANVEAAAKSGELAQLLKASGIDAGGSASVPDAAGGSGGTTPAPPKEAPTPS